MDTTKLLVDMISEQVMAEVDKKYALKDYVHVVFEQSVNSDIIYKVESLIGDTINNMVNDALKSEHIKIKIRDLICETLDTEVEAFINSPDGSYLIEDTVGDRVKDHVQDCVANFDIRVVVD